MNICIRVTEKCNLNCDHCFYKQKNSKDKCDLNYKDICLFLNKINSKEKNNKFFIHGGEPMLSDLKILKEMISMFPNNEWQISTNLCYKLTREKIEVFEKAKNIIISFDVGIRFKNIKNLLLWYKNIKILSKNNNIKIGLNICFSKQLLKHDPIQILFFLDKLNINFIQFWQIIPINNTHESKNIIANNSQVDEWLYNFFLKIQKFKNIKCSNISAVEEGIFNIFNSYYCKNCCNNSLTVNTDGTIINCSSDSINNIIGTIYDDAEYIIENIKNKKYHINKKCLYCKYYDQCGGWCRNIPWDNNCPYPIKLSEGIKNVYAFI